MSCFLDGLTGTCYKNHDLSHTICSYSFTIPFQVADFGLSKIKRNTLVSGGVRGTLPWMAPELLNGSSNKVSEKVWCFYLYNALVEMWNNKLTTYKKYEGESTLALFSSRQAKFCLRFT